MLTYNYKIHYSIFSSHTQIHCFIFCARYLIFDPIPPVLLFSISFLSKGIQSTVMRISFPNDIDPLGISPPYIVQHSITHYFSTSENSRIFIPRNNHNIYNNLKQNDFWNYTNSNAKRKRKVMPVPVLSSYHSFSFS